MTFLVVGYIQRDYLNSSQLVVNVDSGKNCSPRYLNLTLFSSDNDFCGSSLFRIWCASWQINCLLYQYLHSIMCWNNRPDRVGNKLDCVLQAGRTTTGPGHGAWWSIYVFFSHDDFLRGRKVHIHSGGMEAQTIRGYKSSPTTYRMCQSERDKAN